MQISQAQLKSFARTLTQNNARIITSKLPTGEYKAVFADKNLGLDQDISRCISEIKSKDGEYHYINLAGKGEKPNNAALELIGTLPKGEGTIELRYPEHWEDLSTHRKIDYSI